MTLEHCLLSIPIEAVTTQSNLELHSGITRLYPRVYGNLESDSANRGDTWIMLVHPMSNCLGHHRLEPIARSSKPVIGLNTRYAGFDTAVILFNCLIDIAAAVRHARARLGWRKVGPCGFSDSGSLVANYQRQAESPSATCTPAGDPPDFAKTRLPAADAILLIAFSKSRDHILQSWIGPSVTDENDPDSCDPYLDLYAEGRTDVTFVETPVDLSDLRKIGFLPCPQIVNVEIGGNTPAVTATEFADMEFGMVHYANASALSRLKTEGILLENPDVATSFQEPQALVRKPLYDEPECLYGSTQVTTLPMQKDLV